jgi:beta-galactosidase
LQIFVLTGEKPELAWRAAPAVFKWNWPTNDQLTVRAVANCNEVDLLLNNQSLGRHAVSHNVYASDWTVPYAPGVLSAVGYRAGQPVATNELRTTGTPAQLQVTPLASPIPSDIAFYEITVVDDAGLLVSDATPAVTVKVEGAGRLIGLDTGDLNYGGLFKTDSRNAHQGRLLATVQRTAPTGEINVTAVSPDLLTTAAPAR